MSEPRRCESAPKQGETMSIAAQEAFEYLNAGTRKEYRGWGDTRTAARDRAAKLAGVTPAQAERLWKNWKTMKTVNGDVYRALRNRYEAFCDRHENTAYGYRAERLELKAGNNAGDKGASSGSMGMGAS